MSFHVESESPQSKPVVALLFDLAETISASVLSSQAPASANVAMSAALRRYHGTRTSASNLKSYEDGGSAFSVGSKVQGAVYHQRVPNTSQYFLDHPMERTEWELRGKKYGALYSYRDDAIKGDRRVSYKSAEFPWLESASSYEHLKHLPGDYDAIHVTLPPHAVTGHYIVHWGWSGYSDCVDVDYFAHKQVPHVHGVVEEGFASCWVLVLVRGCHVDG